MEGGELPQIAHEKSSQKPTGHLTQDVQEKTDKGRFRNRITAIKDKLKLAEIRKKLHRQKINLTAAGALKLMGAIAGSPIDDAAMPIISAVTPPEPGKQTVVQEVIKPPEHPYVKLVDQRENGTGFPPDTSTSK